MKRPIVHRRGRRRAQAIQAGRLGALVVLAGAWLLACSSVAEPTSGSSSGTGAGGDATSSSASTGGVVASSSSASTGGDTTSSTGASSSSGSSSSSSAGSGLVFVGGGLGTFSESAPGGAGFAIVDQGFETTARVCAGNYCVVGGLVP